MDANITIPIMMPAQNLKVDLEGIATKEDVQILTNRIDRFEITLRNTLLAHGLESSVELFPCDGDYDGPAVNKVGDILALSLDDLEHFAQVQGVNIPVCEGMEFNKGTVLKALGTSLGVKSWCISALAFKKPTMDPTEEETNHDESPRKRKRT
eukprot:TRINITY_DN2965_c0_g1_i1.p1 TRINITY_DN2965_c0_g1~~TRINITY_DN2965_c0_g1_i1.p1  ORF type:complete len:160 (-),score=30.61 TRINITY_DN2965_c0_g1_i1:126-584(-)